MSQNLEGKARPRSVDELGNRGWPIEVVLETVKNHLDSRYAISYNGTVKILEKYSFSPEQKELMARYFEEAADEREKHFQKSKYTSSHKDSIEALKIAGYLRTLRLKED